MKLNVQLKADQFYFITQSETRTELKMFVFGFKFKHLRTSSYTFTATYYVCFIKKYLSPNFSSY